MSTLNTFARASVALFAISLATSVLAQPVNMADVPEAVLETALATAPGVDFHSVSIERANGLDIYEFEAEDYRGRHIEVDVRADGSLEEIEMEIGEAEVPSTVMNALSNELPGFAIGYIEVSIRANGIHVYEFEGRDRSGRRMDIEIGEDGRILATEAFYS